MRLLALLTFFVSTLSFGTGLTLFQINCSKGESNLEIHRFSSTAGAQSVTQYLNFKDDSPPAEIILAKLFEYVEEKDEAKVVKGDGFYTYAQLLRDDEGVIGHLVVHTNKKYSLVDIKTPKYTTNGPDLEYGCKWKVKR